MAHVDIVGQELTEEDFIIVPYNNSLALYKIEKFTEKNIKCIRINAKTENGKKPKGKKPKYVKDRDTMRVPPETATLYMLKGML